VSGKHSAGRQWQYGAVAFAIGLVCALLLMARPAALCRLDDKGFDLLVSALKRHGPTNQVVIVDIDEPSLARLGPWPWPRGLMARMIQRLANSDASVIALDIVLPEPDSAPSSDPTPAWDLTQALRQSHSVTGFDFVFGAARNRASDCARLPKPLAPVWKGQPFPGASAVICDFSRPESQAAASSGFLNSVRDHDGTTRRMPLLAAYRGALYPSFALASAGAGAGSLLLAKGPGTSKAALLLNGKQIEWSDGGRMLLRYRAMPRRSASEVLAGSLPSATFARKIVLIGISANGLEGSLRTPSGAAVPEAEVQANAIDNLIAGDYFCHPAWASPVEMAAIFILSFLAAWLMFRFPSPMGVCGMLAAIAFLWASSEAVLALSGIFLSPMPAALAGLTTLAVCAAIHFNRREPARDPALASRFITGTLGVMTSVRDVETGQHVIRLQGYLRSLCQAVSLHPKFRAYLTSSMVELLVQLAPIHDIGKVGVPDYILRKPGALTPEEFARMKSHVTLGKKILEEARQHASPPDEVFFKTATDIVYSHHEWWDGSGYPLGLRGDAIPIPGRLLAVADVYDALISKRSYKTELLHAEAVEQIRQGAGTHFDPDIVAGFLAVQEDWRRMAEAHRDEPGMAASTT
jgi:adenylate cyclase